LNFWFGGRDDGRRRNFWNSGRESDFAAEDGVRVIGRQEGMKRRMKAEGRRMKVERSGRELFGEGGFGGEFGRNLDFFKQRRDKI